MKNFIRKHHYILILLIISIAFFSGLLSSSKILDNIHYINDMTFLSQNVKESIFKDRTLHLWTPYFYSGQPLMAIPESYLFDLNFIYIILFRNIFLAMNLAVISYFFIAGAGMYFLSLEFAKEKKAAFISALVFMFNGFFFSFVLLGHLNILESYSLVPLVIFFVVRAVRGSAKTECVKNSAYAGLFLALQILAGGIIFSIYTVLISFMFIAFNFIFGALEKNFSETAKKSAIAAVILLIMGLGISAIKLMPSLEYTSMSSRSSSVSYQEYLGQPIDIKDILSTAVTGIGYSGFSAALTIIGSVLVLFSLKSIKKKHVMFFVLLMAAALLISSGTFLAEIFYKLPAFGKMRHIERALVMFSVSGAVLAGAGYIHFEEFIKSKLKNKTNKTNISEKAVFVVLSLLIITEPIYAYGFPHYTNVIKPKDIPLLNYLSNEKPDFRTINLGMRDLIGAEGYNYNAQLGIGTIKGGGGIWTIDYIKIMSIAQYNPAKVYGIMNGKYIISDFEINDSNFELVEKFESCSENCGVREAWGPYLYKNKKYLPRYYAAGKSILITGKDDNSEKMYNNIIASYLDFSSSAVIFGKNIDSYSYDELKKFDAVVMTSPPENKGTYDNLKMFYDNGGKILPDIFAGNNTITTNDLLPFFSEETPEKIEPKSASSRKVLFEIKKENLKSKNNYLVLSEQFAIFDGWRAKLNGKEVPILKANGIISAILLEEEGLLEISYMPKSFSNGMSISLISLILFASFILFFKYIKKRSKKPEEMQQKIAEDGKIQN